MEQAARKGDVTGTMQATAFQLLYEHIKKQIDPKTKKPVHPQIARLIANHVEAAYYRKKRDEYSSLLERRGTSTQSMPEDANEKATNPEVDAWRNTEEELSPLSEIVEKSMAHFLDNNGIEEALADALKRYSSAEEKIRSFNLGETMVERYNKGNALSRDERRELDDAYDQKDTAIGFVNDLLPAHLQREGISEELAPAIRESLFSDLGDEEATSDWVREKIRNALNGESNKGQNPASGQ